MSSAPSPAAPICSRRSAGVLVVDRAAVDRINPVDEAITIATLPAFKPVVEGEMIATVKMIPFGVEAKLRDAAVAVAGKDALRVAPYGIRKVGVVSTLLPGLAPKVIDKTLRVTAERLAPAGAAIIAERRVPHEEAALAAAIKELLGLGAELVIVFGASAIADRRDVIPAAITGVGGAIEHFGMPVDPGNLLADRQRRRRAGAGCARLRALAGGKRLRLGADAAARRPQGHARRLMGMGVGGLLMEIVTRPQPRTVAESKATATSPPSCWPPGVDPDGRPQQAAGRDRRQEAGADRGRAGAGLESDRGDRRHRPSGRTGRAGAGGPEGEVRPESGFRRRAGHSVKAGIAAVPRMPTARSVCLGDMPLIDAKLIDRLIETFAPDRGHLIAVPVSEGRRGNPVLWSRRFFRELMTLDGDVGARHLIAKHTEAVAEVPVDGDGALLDIDTPQALEAARSSSGKGVLAPCPPSRVPPVMEGTFALCSPYASWSN